MGSKITVDFWQLLRAANDFGFKELYFCCKVRNCPPPLVYFSGYALLYVSAISWLRLNWLFDRLDGCRELIERERIADRPLALRVCSLDLLMDEGNFKFFLWSIPDILAFALSKQSYNALVNGWSFPKCKVQIWTAFQ